MTYRARHPGEGRDPVTTTLAQATQSLDSGLRRNDGQKPISAYATARLRVFEIIPDSSERKPGSSASRLSLGKSLDSSFRWDDEQKPSP
jgi:hypothetical protein